MFTAVDMSAHFDQGVNHDFELRVLPSDHQGVVGGHLPVVTKEAAKTIPEILLGLVLGVTVLGISVFRRAVRYSQVVRAVPAEAPRKARAVLWGVRKGLVHAQWGRLPPLPDNRR